MINTVVYKHIMDRAPTLEDRAQKIGMEGFLKRLQDEGWTDENFVCLKRCSVTYEGHAEPGNNYIEWSAVLIEEQILT